MTGSISEVAMKRAFFLLVLFVLVFPASLHARTWHVRQDGSGDCTTIQACCGAASTNDTVLVAPGTYVENVNTHWVGLLKSESGATVTILNWPAAQTNYCVLVAGNCVVDGFTIRGGIASAPGVGGVYLFNGSLRNCLIIDNVNFAMDGPGEGGGVRAYGSAVIEDNTIVKNGKYPFPYMEGAGIYCYHSFTGAIRRNIIVQNWGGGIFCEPGAAPTIECNNVWGNVWGDYRGSCSDQTGANGNISVDPLFCDAQNGDYRLRSDSPCANAPGCGQIGAFGIACGPTSVTETTWGRIKALFR